MREFVVETWPALGEPQPHSAHWASRRAAGRILRIAAAVILVAGVALWIARAAKPLSAEGPGTPGRSAPAAWRDIEAPDQIYRLEAPDFAAAPLTYAARRHLDGGGREDVLSLGAFDGAGPALRLRIFRGAAEAPGAAPLFAALAHEAAAAGLAVGRSGLPELLPTRFGRFEIADLSLVRPDDSASIPCSGMRLTLEDPAMSITGLACGARAAPLTRTAIGCLVEQLEIAGGDSDRAVADFFGQAEARRRDECAARPQPTQASPEADRYDRAAEPDNAATGRRRLRRR